MPVGALVFGSTQIIKFDRLIQTWKMGSNLIAKLDNYL